MVAYEANKKASENFLHEKYTAPYEFPDLLFDGDIDDIDAFTNKGMNGDSDADDDDDDDSNARSNDYYNKYQMNNSNKLRNGSDSLSSTNLSSKLPKISDSDFRRTLELAKNIKRKSSTKSNPIYPQVSQTNVLNQKLEKPHKNDTVLTSSTPKNINVSSNENYSINNKPNNISSQLQSEERKNDFERDQEGYMYRLVESMQQQALKIGKLEEQLKEKDKKIIDVKNAYDHLYQENNTLLAEKDKLTNDFENLSVNNQKYSKESEDYQNQKKLLEERCDHLSNKYDSTTSQYKRQQEVLTKEKELYENVIRNYDIKFESLNTENSQLTELIDAEKKTALFWKQRYEKLENKSKSFEEKIQTAEAEIERLNLKLAKESDLVEKYTQLEMVFNNKINDNEKLIKENEIVLLENTELKKSNESLKEDKTLLKNEISKIDNETLKSKTEFITKYEVLQAELSHIQNELNEINTKYNELLYEKKSVKKEHDDFKNKIIGDEAAITSIQFGKQLYSDLEMNKVDELSVIVMQNIIKNILKSLNVKFSDLKGHIVFIREYIFVFFDEIHSYLHGKTNGNSITIDKSVHLDITDQEKMKKCMEILLKDVKELKGIV